MEIKVSDHCRSYSTERRLRAELKERGLDQLTWLLYRHGARFTAVFFLRNGETHNAYSIASQGFTVIG